MKNYTLLFAARRICAGFAVILALMAYFALSAHAQEAQSDSHAQPALSVILAAGEFTLEQASAFHIQLDRVWMTFQRFFEGFSGTEEIDWAFLLPVLGEIALLIITLWFVTSFLQSFTGKKVEEWIEHLNTRNMLHRAAFLAGLALFRIAIAVAAWSAGWLVAIFVTAIAETTTPNFALAETLLLNAFFLVQLSRIAIRFTLAPNLSQLRLTPINDFLARYLARALARIVTGLGYVILLIVPLLVDFGLNHVADLLHLLTVFIAAGYLIYIGLRQYKRVSAQLLDAQSKSQYGFERLLLLISVRVWPAIFVGFVLLFFLPWQLDQNGGATFTLLATLYSIGTIFLARIFLNLLSRLHERGIAIGASWRELLPNIDQRLNKPLPMIVAGLRIIVLLVAFLAVLEFWQLIDIADLEAMGAGGYINNLVGALLVLLAGFVIWLLTMSWIDSQLKSKPATGAVSARAKTLFELLRNTLTILLLVMITMLSLSELGINIGPLLAGAGVFGLAISFGAQKLVQDVITGVFIQFENAMNEGDVVTVGGITGVVEKLTIRSARLRDLSGTSYVIPFSSVDTVANSMRDYSFHVVSIGVGYNSDIEAVQQAMQGAFDRLRESEFGDDILEDLEFHGITEFGDNAITVRARIKTKPGAQWGLGRAFSAFMKQEFDKKDIEIPYPQVTFHRAREIKATPSTPPRPAKPAHQITEEGGDSENTE